MSVLCGNEKAHGAERVYHETAADVRVCFQTLKRSEARGRVTRCNFFQEAADVDRISQEQADRYRRNELASYGIAYVDQASPAQLRYLIALLAEREIPPALGLWADELKHDIEAANVTKREASEAITTLKALGYRTKKATSGDYAKVYSNGMEEPVLATADGMYRNPATGEIFRIQYNRAQGSGRHLYVKRLVILQPWDAEKEERPASNSIPLTGEKPGPGVEVVEEYIGSIAKAGVLAAWRMRLEDAEKFGALYGQCLRCRRTLTARESIARAMGPICSGKANWA